MEINRKIFLSLRQRLFKNLGIYPKDKNGYLYPWSEQASAVREAGVCAETGKDLGFIPGSRIWDHTKENGFQISFSKDGKKGMISGEARSLRPDQSGTKLGSDGSGYMTWQKCWDISWFRLSRLWVQLGAGEKLYRQVAGVRTMEKVTVFIDRTETASDIGELQLTDYGISGIPVFQISRYAGEVCMKKKEVFAELVYAGF